MHKILPSNHKRNMLTQLRGLGPASAAILSREIFAGRFATRRQLGSYLVRRLYFVLTIRGVDAVMRILRRTVSGRSAIYAGPPSSEHRFGAAASSDIGSCGHLTPLALRLHAHRVTSESSVPVTVA